MTERHDAKQVAGRRRRSQKRTNVWDEKVVKKFFFGVMQRRLYYRQEAALMLGKLRASGGKKKSAGAQHHVASVLERGLVGGREEWEEFTARSCVCAEAQGEGGREGEGRRSNSLSSLGEWGQP